ncbi:MAG: VOC family protein, partial [Prevotellamassilia sp.]
MEISAKFDHFNINVLDLDRSIAFYKEALGLTPSGEINGPEGAFKIIYLKNEESDFKLELTWLRDRTEPYNLGENEFHI